MLDENKIQDELEILREKIKNQESVIEELRLSEKELKNERILMNALMDTIPDSIYFKDNQGRQVKFSHKMQENLDLDESQIIGKNDVELYGEEFGSKSLIDDLEIIKTARPIIGQIESRCLKDGRVNWTMTNKVPIRDESGQIMGLVGITRDINELIKTQKELEHERILLRTLIDNIPDYIYLKNIEGQFLIANNATLHQFGIKSESELIGKSDYDLFPTELAKKYFSEEQLILTSEKGIYNFEGPTVDKSKVKKNRWVSTTKVPFYDSQDKIMGSLGIGRDITERKEMEEKLHKLNEELKELNNTKDKLFSIIAHDLRSPFIGFIGLTEMMAEGVVNFSQEELSNLSKEMQKSAEDLLKLLTNLLDWARMQQDNIILSPIKIELSEIISQNINLMTVRSEQKKVEIICDIVNNQTVYADEAMLNSILCNLLSNALKFTSKGGKVIVKSKETNNDMMEISVIDTGIGMPTELCSKLFKIDEKVGRKGTEGETSTGLGLMLCKEFVEKHGGKIWVESQINMGSTFNFTLPRGSRENKRSI